MNCTMNDISHALGGGGGYMAFLCDLVESDLVKRYMALLCDLVESDRVVSC